MAASAFSISASRGCWAMPVHSVPRRVAGFSSTSTRWRPKRWEPDARRRRQMLPQIVEERPLPFVRHGMRPWLEVERMLGRALAKDPEQRFASVSDFADALAHAG